MIEATVITKALVLSSAGLAGLDVSSQSPERFVAVVRQAFDKPDVRDKRRPEAVANLLRWIAATLEVAQQQRISSISESTVDDGQKRVCPVYPFD
jgi:hypothetical protein